MAAAKQTPILATPLLAQEAFERDLAIVLEGRHTTLAEAGWTRPHPLGLLVPLKAPTPGKGTEDEYFLRLEFHYYPDWPPSAQFINPLTGGYAGESDLHWLPRIEGSTEIQIHKNYPPNHGQVICSSVTLEFYKVLHDIEPRYLWDYKRQNFASTINQIEWALATNFYKGRHA